MCVIAVKKRGVNLPNETSIKAMWDTNSDGAGFMYVLKDKVHIEKGFMKLQDFNNALVNLDKTLRKNDMSIADIPLVMHFRITTHGGTSPELTHPYPISSQEKHLKALDLTCDLGLVHNGIISSVITKIGLNDTQSYIADVLTPLAYLKNDFYMSKEGKAIMENTIGASKFAFLDNHGNIELIGDFKNGTKNGTESVLFSNLAHEWETRGFTYPYVYGARTGGSVDTSGTSEDYYYGHGWDLGETSIMVKKLPKGVMIATDMFFTSGDTGKNHLKTLKDKDVYYIDKYDTLYLETKTGHITESKYFTTPVRIKDGYYVAINGDDLKDVKEELKEVL